MPHLRSSRRTTRASGQTLVFAMSVITSFEGSSLLPVPMQLMTGTSSAWQRFISAILDGTESIASTT